MIGTNYFSGNEMSSNFDKAMKEYKKNEEKIRNFSDLLDTLSTVADKKKHLWKEIYENAVNDRESAGILFTDLMIQTKGNMSNHQNYGTIMTKYLERMCKSNDQILKLAELISAEEEKSVNLDDIYEKIGS